MQDAPNRNVFVWVDIPVVDLERAQTFYSAVIGQDVALIDMPGFRFCIFPYADTSVSGCLYTAQTHHNAPSMTGPLVYLNVDGRMIEAQGAVEANGGRIEQPAEQIGEHGYRALVVDSEGNRIALHSQQKP